MIGQIKNPSFIEGLLGVPTTGLEPVAYGLEIRCSIQLSYVGIAEIYINFEVIYKSFNRK
tara:strand:+ start:42 stop:221 length:180 start_codon:yes stop_codon:yes gene_type:complete